MAPATNRERTTLIDQAKLRRRIEPLHLDLLTHNEEYRALLSATCNADAIEGSLLCDEISAAQMLRDAAAKTRRQFAAAGAARLDPQGADKSACVVRPEPSGAQTLALG